MKSSDISTKLSEAMLTASERCNHPIDEEGGLILNLADDYCFIFINNIHAATPQAVGLYEADADVFAANVLPKLQRGWKMFSSFHTHPRFSADPSSLDFAKLFQGFRHNIIYAPLYDSEPGTFSITEWIKDTPHTTKITKRELLKKTHE